MKKQTSDFGRYVALLLAIIVVGGILTVAVPAMLHSLAEAQTTACQTVFQGPDDCQ